LSFRVKTETDSIISLKHEGGVMLKRYLLLALICLSFGIFACGGSQLKVEPIAKTESPAELIQKLEMDVSTARQDQVNVLSPNWFEKSEASLNAAKEKLEEGEEISDILEHIAEGRAQLLTARDKSQLSRSVLPKVIQNRTLARQAGAPSLGEDYAKVEARFLNLTRAVEKDNISYAKNRRKGVATEYRRLEIRAIKVRTLGEVRSLLQRAKRGKTFDIAPRTYQQAQQKLAEADAFISKNPYAKEQMRRKAQAALFSAKRHLEIARQAKELKDMQPESTALLIERDLQAIADKLQAPDMRDRSFDTQVENIVGSIAALQYERSAMREKVNDQQKLTDQLQARLAELEGKTKAVQSARERLLAEKQFNELFEKVRTYFDPQEAEVYKREGQLIIRLKAMGFPVGQSIILPKNYALLSKVQRAVRTFDEVDLIIEGHTDSTGSEEVNDLLSEQRADAVRQYLVANGTLAYDKIIAVGYGSHRPLASNKTEKGRAINRRIDLIITPHFTPAAGAD
jgi:outer membrane protein OmpA-like peptidoglycan-associated protein